MQPKCHECGVELTEVDHTTYCIQHNGRFLDMVSKAEATHCFCQDCAGKLMVIQRVNGRTSMAGKEISDLWWSENLHGYYYKGYCFVGTAPMATVFGAYTERATWKLHFSLYQERCSEFTVHSGEETTVSSAKKKVEEEIRMLLKELRTQGVEKGDTETTLALESIKDDENVGGANLAEVQHL